MARLGQTPTQMLQKRSQSRQRARLGPCLLLCVGRRWSRRTRPAQGERAHGAPAPATPGGLAAACKPGRSSGRLVRRLPRGRAPAMIAAAARLPSAAARTIEAGPWAATSPAA